jgi:hypothetical protein
MKRNVAFGFCLLVMFILASCMAYDAAVTDRKVPMPRTNP